MPTVKIIGPYRFYFVSLDQPEPAHIHVKRERMVAKFWLGPVRLAKAGGFKGRELRRIEKLVTENEAEFVEAWNEFFSD